jgi:hypothetical protein
MAACDLRLLCSGAQTTQLFSADGSVFLYVTYDGNVQLYNTASYNQYGLNSAGAIIWQSKTGGNSPQPFQLVMQDVRAPHPPSCAAAQCQTRDKGVRACLRTFLGGPRRRGAVKCWLPACPLRTLEA